jgi:hypothetical protein
MGINPIADIASGIAGPLFGLVDKLFTSDEEREAAKLAIMKAEQAGELDTLKTNLSAILAEANSADPWTSRARPSFLYVMYILLLASIPMGFLFAFEPQVADAVILGFKGWLNAIPESLYALFGAGYLGYAGFRSWDKRNGVSR